MIDKVMVEFSLPGPHHVEIVEEVTRQAIAYFEAMRGGGPAYTSRTVSVGRMANLSVRNQLRRRITMTVSDRGGKVYSYLNLVNEAQVLATYELVGDSGPARRLHDIATLACITTLVATMLVEASDRINMAEGNGNG